MKFIFGLLATFFFFAALGLTLQRIVFGVLPDTSPLYQHIPCWPFGWKSQWVFFLICLAAAGDECEPGEHPKLKRASEMVPMGYLYDPNLEEWVDPVAMEKDYEDTMKANGLVKDYITGQWVKPK